MPDAARVRDRLTDAADRFDALGRKIEVGRCLIDAADAERRMGEDPTPTLAGARKILESCGAQLFLREAETVGSAATSRSA